MTKNKLIHVKLDYGEALQSRKDILQTEADLIMMAKSIRRYRRLRGHELALKSQLKKLLKDFKTDYRKAKTLLPKLEIPKILKKHEKEIHEKEELEEIKKELPKKKEAKKKTAKKAKKEIKKPIPKDDLEFQLEEIQSKLRKLE